MVFDPQVSGCSGHPKPPWIAPRLPFDPRLQQEGHLKTCSILLAYGASAARTDRGPRGCPWDGGGGAARTAWRWDHAHLGGVDVLSAPALRGNPAVENRNHVLRLTPHLDSSQVPEPPNQQHALEHAPALLNPLGVFGASPVGRGRTDAPTGASRSE